VGTERSTLLSLRGSKNIEKGRSLYTFVFCTYAVGVVYHNANRSGLVLKYLAFGEMSCRVSIGSSAGTLSVEFANTYGCRRHTPNHRAISLSIHSVPHLAAVAARDIAEDVFRRAPESLRQPASSSVHLRGSLPCPGSDLNQWSFDVVSLEPIVDGKSISRRCEHPFPFSLTSHF
jgi:hypothetical protein